jgi:hypothetical protein
LLAAASRRHGRGGGNRPQPNPLTRELVSDSRVLIDHARLLVRNSSARIDRIEKRLAALISAIEAAGTTPSGNRRIVELRRWLDRRDAA